MRIACCLILAIGLLGSETLSAGAQEADPSTPAAVDATAPDETTPTPEPTLESTVAPVVAAETDTPVAADPATEVPPADVATETPTDVATKAPATATASATPTATEVAATATPEPPALRATPDLAPACKLADSSTDVVSSGGAAVYDCVYAVTLSGARLAPAWISIDWSLAVTVSGGWTAQLLPKLPDAVWVDAGGDAPPLKLRTGVSPTPAAAVVDAFDGAAELAFQVRLTRPACDLEPAELQFAVSGTPALPGHDNAAITTDTAPPPAQPYKLTPALAPIPEPSIDFAGPLSLGTIDVTAEGPASPAATGAVAVTVSGLNLTCGNWTVKIQGKTLTGSNGVDIPARTLTLTSINGAPLPGGPCDLDGKCLIADVPAGPSAADSATFTLGVSLAIPDQPGAGTFGSSLSATVARTQ